MRIEHSRDSQKQYLVLSGGDTPSSRAYPVCMLTENEIPGFLSCRTEEIDRQLRFIYDITDMQTLRDAFRAGETGRERLVLLLRTLAEAMEMLDRYLLPADSLQLSPDLIFLDRNSGAVRLVCYPDRESSFTEQIQLFSEHLLSVLKNDDRDAVVIGYAFYQKCRDSVITADGLRQLAQKRACRPLSSARGTAGHSEPETQLDADWLFDAGSSKKKENDLLTGGKKTGWMERLLPFTSRCRRTTQKKKASLTRGIRGREKRRDGTGHRRTPARTGGTEDSGKEEHTVLLSGEKAELSEFRAVLVPVRSRGQMPLRLFRDQSILGRNPAAADLVVASPLVSRVHARLLWQEGQYCIEDVFSKNGTWVNGIFLSPGSRQRLESGDELLVGDRKFRYELNSM